MYKASFYPGPSRVYSNIPEYIYDAYREGILTANHRSETFHKLMAKLKRLLRVKLEVPKNYEIVFTSSATECWAILAQSLTVKESLHIFNGAFGEKWHEAASGIHGKTEAIAFDPQEEFDLSFLPESYTDLVCITQNETSNGTQISNAIIKGIREKLPKALLAIDATSSMGGIALEIKQADIWYASVQKCFGLPAGLAVMILSPNAVKRAQEIDDRSRYNSLLNILKHYQRNEAPYTPNVTNIYLLSRVLEKSKGIQELNEKVLSRAAAWYQFFEQTSLFKPYIKNAAVRSQTVIALEQDSNSIARVKKDAKSLGIILGNGYGSLKDHTFRIANFPAIKGKEIELLTKFLMKNYSQS